MPQGKNTPGLLTTVSNDKRETCPTCGGHGWIAPENITIGMRFKQCRTKIGKTQGEVAPDLRIGRAQLANVEGDRSRPGIELLVRAADVFGVSADYLLGRQ